MTAAFCIFHRYPEIQHYMIYAADKMVKEINILYGKNHTSSVSLQKACVVAALSRGSFSDGPNILGKYSGRSRPKHKLASVTVRGPPLR